MEIPWNDSDSQWIYTFSLDNISLGNEEDLEIKIGIVYDYCPYGRNECKDGYSNFADHDFRAINISGMNSMDTEQTPMVFGTIREFDANGCPDDDLDGVGLIF